MNKPVYYLDFEASGLQRSGFPIEIAVAKEGTLIQHFLIQPDQTWQAWDPAAEALHGIGRQQLHEQGSPTIEVAKTLNQVLAGKTVYCDNWLFDHRWLMKLYESANMHPSYRLESIFRDLDEQQQSMWIDAKCDASERLDLIPHRADADVLIMHDAYLHLTNPELNLSLVS